MTLFNTFANLGLKWPPIVVLKLVDLIVLPVQVSICIFGISSIFVNMIWYYFYGAKITCYLESLTDKDWSLKQDMEEKLITTQHTTSTYI